MNIGAAFRHGDSLTLEDARSVDFGCAPARTLSPHHFAVGFKQHFDSSVLWRGIGDDALVVAAYRHSHTSHD